MKLDELNFVQFFSGVLALFITQGFLCLALGQPFSTDSSIALSLENFESSYKQLPLNSDVFGVRLYQDDHWEVYRTHPSGHSDVFYKSPGGEVTRIDLSLRWRINTYPLLVLAKKDRLLIVGYDVVRNIPTGRTLSAKPTVFHLYEITPSTQGEPRVISDKIDLKGSLDSLLYGEINGSTMSLCAENTCIDVMNDGSIMYWPTDMLSEYEFIEVVFTKRTIYALVRKSWDDRKDGRLSSEFSQYFLATIEKSGTNIDLIDESSGVPYYLRISDGMPIWSSVKDKNGIRDLIFFEFSRMRNGGLIDYGENNLEGRIAWSQVYYLNGLLSVGSGDLSYVDQDLREYALRRVSAELNLMAELSLESYPGFSVKRYSVEREPLLFALHLGRIARLFSRASTIGITPILMDRILTAFREELIELNHTVEHVVPCIDSEINDCISLYYKTGYPFWADGANVPYNYVSGYTIGLLYLFSPAEVLQAVNKLMQPLIEYENFRALPIHWRYWSPLSRDGWTYQTGRSLNTPMWAGVGNGADIAHITYRTMDAKTLVRLFRLGSDLVSEDEVSHFTSLVAEGQLLPSLNEELEGLGMSARLNIAVARRFARSSQVWQLQSQVWALDGLLQD